MRSHLGGAKGGSPRQTHTGVPWGSRGSGDRPIQDETDQQFQSSPVQTGSRRDPTFVTLIQNFQGG